MSRFSRSYIKNHIFYVITPGINMSYIFEKCDFLFNFIGNFVISYILKFAGIYPYFLTFLLKKFLKEM